MEEKFTNHLELEFEKLGNNSPEVSSISNVYGGSINQSYKLKTAGGNYFVKTNDAKEFPEMFEKEASGLSLLRSANAINIPSVFTNGVFENKAYLILEFIDSGVETPDFWESFGRRLAEMHQKTADYFGLKQHNYIGSLQQQNHQKESWSDFFIENRLMVQLELAKANRVIGTSMMRDFELLFSRLKNYFPEEKPSLLHGDLWSGNFMVDAEGEPLIMDPAVYYGHREMDLGMSKLFGGFNQRFYEAYNESLPMEKGWEERIEICNLYPLLVHVNLFGSGYLSAVKRALRLLV